MSVRCAVRYCRSTEMRLTGSNKYYLLTTAVSLASPCVMPCALCFSGVAKIKTNSSDLIRNKYVKLLPRTARTLTFQAPLHHLGTTGLDLITSYLTQDPCRRLSSREHSVTNQVNRISLFYPRDVVSGVLATATCLAGWLAGCPSHAGIVSKWLNLSENFFDHLKAPSF